MDDRSLFEKIWTAIQKQNKTIKRDSYFIVKIALECNSLIDNSI